MQIKKLIRDQNQWEQFCESILESKSWDYDIWADFDRSSLEPFFQYNRSGKTDPMSPEEEMSFKYYLKADKDDRHIFRVNVRDSFRNINEDVIRNTFGYEDISTMYEDYNWVLKEQNYPFVFLMWADSQEKDCVFYTEKVYMEDFA